MKQNVFSILPENTWLNTVSEEKWVKWEPDAAGLKLSAVEVWCDNSILLTELAVPSESREIQEIVQQLHRGRAIAGYLSESFRWVQEGQEKSLEDTEVALIVTLCAAIGDISRDIRYRTHEDAIEVLRSFGIRTVRLLGSQQEIELSHWSPGSNA